jgi:hypothetical protein
MDGNGTRAAGPLSGAGIVTTGGPDEVYFTVTLRKLSIGDVRCERFVLFFC